MKRTFYILLFTLLGIILSFLLHAVLEIPILHFLLPDFKILFIEMSWQQWKIAHGIGGTGLFLGGVFLGFKQGVYWWDCMYVKNRKPKWYSKK